VGGLSVTAFPKFHDASDPHSFVISFNGTNVGIFTDIGNNCNHVISHFKKCHAVFLETNYDEDMLANGTYPVHLKRRISGGNGHLSNAQALELFLQHRPAFLRYLLLSHLSKENNCPNLVTELFQKNAGGTTVVVASRYSESAVYTVDRGDSPAVALPVIQGPPAQLQLSF
jgi:phosphoribosyl 1,2-cyclic phosphodiesterase